MTEVSGEESYVSKLTVKTLGCVPSAVKAMKPEELVASGGKLALCRLYGKAAEVKYQDDKNNPGTVHTYFVGTFEGINLQDGTVLRSGKLFLPKGISEVVEMAIKNAKARNKDDSVAFAFEIRSVVSTNPIGYSYEAAALKSPEAEDELKEMREIIAKLPTHDQKRLAAAQGKGAPPKTLEGQHPAKKSA
jgi:hypothetical protein